MNKILIALFIIMAVLVFYYHVNASESIYQNLESAAQGADYGNVSESTIPTLIGQIVRIVLSFVGAIFFILIIVSGIQWMTAGGSEEKVTKSKTRLINASIGLAIAVTAYFITWFISSTLLSTSL